TDIHAFNGKFMRMVQALNWADDQGMLGVYMTHMPATLRELILTLPVNATLQQAMDIVTNCIEAHAQAHSSNAMDIGAIDLGSFAHAPVTRNQRACPKDQTAHDWFQVLKNHLLAEGVTEAQIQDCLAKNVCLHCGKGGHHATNCTVPVSGNGQ
ncbi:hypothetical protein LPJ61_007015, partial [Coemansia biformis]